MPTTWNPADKAPGLTLSNGDLTVELTGSPDWRNVRSTWSKTTGKWYWEVLIDLMGDVGNFAGAICQGGTALVGHYVGKNASSYGYRGGVAGQKYFNNSPELYGDAYGTGHIIGTAPDLDNRNIWWSLDGVWQEGGDPSAGTGEAYSLIAGTFFAIVSLYRVGDKMTANFGATPFTYPVPNGFTGPGLPPIIYKLTGTVAQMGSPVERKVAAFIRSTLEVYSTVTSNPDGTFSLDAPDDTTEMYILALDDDPGDQYNALIYDRVKGVVV